MHFLVVLPNLNLRNKRSNFTGFVKQALGVIRPRVKTIVKSIEIQVIEDAGILLLSLQNLVDFFIRS